MGLFNSFYLLSIFPKLEKNRSWPFNYIFLRSEFGKKRLVCFIGEGPYADCLLLLCFSSIFSPHCRQGDGKQQSKPSGWFLKSWKPVKNVATGQCKCDNKNKLKFLLLFNFFNGLFYADRGMLPAGACFPEKKFASVIFSSQNDNKPIFM